MKPDGKSEVEEELHEDTGHRILIQLRELSSAMQKARLAEYVELLNNVPRMLYLNFLAGLARGVGMAIGFTLLGALVIWVLQRMLAQNLPLIGNFIAELVQIVQFQLTR